ncbi:hypothetical protein SShM2_132 [Synechococcus phage S-ShM2]|uniref:Uncharacterized protein n=1 Tax=Synechococcus phage S-ShM2 TaxID=445683 RepID=E3SK33_9CAUD|nr:hypothetical protein SShM2_132 [Synechococcus phage S-ShM2]ADO97743.1 hypothetical protein SShM2_132 [Synechococcus phage S-ShM2]
MLVYRENRMLSSSDLCVILPVLAEQPHASNASEKKKRTLR